MKRFGYGIGLVLLVFAAATGVAHLLAFLTGAAALPVTLASLWNGLDASSLQGFQDLVERRLSPALWQLVYWLLLLPSWITLGLPALALVLLCRPRPRGFD